MYVHKYIAYFIMQNYNIESFSLFFLDLHMQNKTSIDNKLNQLQVTTLTT